MENIFNEIRTEREKQEAKWGQQDYPILDPVLIGRSSRRMCQEYEIPSEDRAKQIVNFCAERDG